MNRITRIIAACTAGAIIITLSAYVIILDDKRAGLENQLAGVYQRSFDELKSDVDSLEAKLLKLDAATGTNQYTMLLLDVWRQTGDTESSIAALPVGYEGASPLTQFMNRTGDYCRYLSGKLAQGQELTSDDMNQIRLLAQACRDISGKLEELWQQGYVVDLGQAANAFLAQDTTGSGIDFTNQEFPRLIYDGPFSESTENKKPEGLGDGEVTMEQARAAAAAFIGVGEDTLTENGEINSDILCYEFSGDLNSNPYSICITKQGGQVLWYMCSRNTGISALPADARYDELVQIAKQYLLDKGYGETTSSYAQFYGGMAVINLAPVQDGAVLYPDLIKVWVDISANDVTGIDARNYIMSHKQRELNAPELSQDDARARVNSAIVISAERLALIPMDTGEEKLCWEFTGSLNENEFIVYIDAKTGEEADILMIEDTNEGTLVM